MKRTYVKLLTVAGLTGCFLFTSCRSAQETTARYEISKVEGNMITIDSTWDANPDKKTDAWMLSCKLKKGNARKMLLYADCFWTMYGSKRRKAKSLRRSWTDV